MKKLLLKLAASAEIIKIIAKYEPLYIAYALPQVILTAVLPLLYVYAPKMIIEKLTDGSPYIDVINVIAIYTGILLLINIINTILSSKSGLYAEKFSKKLRFEIGKITMELAFKDIESANFRDIIGMANNAAGLTVTMSLVQNIIANIITIAGFAYIIIQLDYLFILLVAVILSVKIIFTYYRYTYNRKMRKLFAKNDRVGNYLTGIAYFNEGGAKEIRVNSLQNWFIGKIKYFRNEMVDLQYKDFRRYAIYEILTAVIMAGQSFLVLWILSLRYINSTVSIADFTMYFFAVASLTACLSTITEQIGSYNQEILNVADYKKLIDIKMSENNGVIGNAKHFDIKDKTEFIFHNVSFAYPNTEKLVLDNINIKITDKEKLVVVGPNGAGKSTFIKLLFKFYRPTSGIITLNGMDIWSFPNDEYYKIIAAVFQDYTNFSFSLAENVSMTESKKTEKVAEVLFLTGLGKYAKELPHGLDTYISKNFNSNGTELSGGQGQKLAIARAIYKDTPVLILDEPTASLDPKAESEIYEDFFNLTKDKTTIFISHRLAISTIADNIAVFADRRIKEYGSHSELMKQNSLYAEMFRKQSKPYVDE